MAVTHNPVAAGSAGVGSAGYLAIVIQWASTAFFDVGMSTEAAIGLAMLLAPFLIALYAKLGVPIPNGLATPPTTTEPKP
jgi:hypothetical protein